jgi:hypothetical protein
LNRLYSGFDGKHSNLLIIGHSSPFPGLSLRCQAGLISKRCRDLFRPFFPLPTFANHLGWGRTHIEIWVRTHIEITAAVLLARMGRNSPKMAKPLRLLSAFCFCKRKVCRRRKCRSYLRTSMASCVAPGVRWSHLSAPPSAPWNPG